MHGTLNKQTIVQRRADGESVTEGGGPVRKLNAQIRKVIERLPHDKDLSLAFFCECGCCEAVQLTIAEYDASVSKPLYLAGHPA
jgi:hypothetical protein